MNIKILLVEDEAPIRMFTRINLENEGFQILEAESGEEGVRIARSEKPDIVVLDLMLPGISGYEVCEILRTEMPHIGIIMLTAKSQEIDRILGLEKGTDDYMVKPFNPHELVLRVRSLIRRLKLDDGLEIPHENANHIEDGPFTLDLYARTFSKNGQWIDLTPTELSIIKMFMTHPGKALSREEILHQAWGEDYRGESKIVDVNVRRIRAKIEDNAAKPAYLETVWGVGYRWKKSE
ncbi:response regulator transcription factor [uncultured Levyella sp.]|uniref:response regulator transcription factor n=1 Tax=uncultured Levyella sp. TaxID=1715800 RepID=UPI002584B23C|nr:response regulator transcription factor [uncultured Levyella sp.]